MRVLAPSNAPIGVIEDFVKRSEGWIEKHKRGVMEHSSRFPDLSAEEMRQKKQEALTYLCERTQFFSEMTGLAPSNIRISTAKTRFGSCSPKNSISYSVYLMNYPKTAIDYVVLHELCHIKYKDHGAKFYALIEKYMPDYKQRIKLLRT